ncbi:UL16-binding protein 3-like [Thomomys bottae]
MITSEGEKGAVARGVRRHPPAVLKVHEPLLAFPGSALAGGSGPAPRCTWILWLICGLIASETADAHTLSYNITTVWGQRWYEAHGQVDQQTFLYYNSSTGTCIPVGPLGKKVSEAKAWTEQPEILKQVGDMLQRLPPPNKLGDATAKYPHTLMGRMTCESDGNGKINGSCQFSYNGQIFLHFDSKSHQWTEDHLESSWIKNILEEKTSMTNFFYRTLEGDCTSWLKQFLGPWAEMLQPTDPPTPNRSSRNTLSSYYLILLAFAILFVY